MMVEVNYTPNFSKQFNVSSEKELERVFVDQLRKSGWFVETQKKTEEGNRIDVLAIHHSCPTEYFIFELKYFTGIHDYTKALKQISDKYYKKKLTYKGISTSLVALITPFSLYHYVHERGWIDKSTELDRVPMIIERFFWRFGFGVGSLEDFSVTFTSQGSDAKIKFASPNDNYRSLHEKINLIKERQHWND